jgi:hypothetical protein
VRNKVLPKVKEEILLKDKQKESWKCREDKEEYVSSYWMVLGKKEDTGD